MKDFIFLLLGPIIMAKSRDKAAQRKSHGSVISTVVGIGLVLFMLGTLGLILLNAQKLSHYVKENFRFEVYLKDQAAEADILKFQKQLDAAPYSRETYYISKADATEKFEADLGEDFMEFIEGSSPIPATIDVKLNANYAHPDSLDWIEKEVMSHSEVRDVNYSKDLISKINENIKRIGIFLLVFSMLLLIIAVALINNTIRLAMYSKRFIIRSMQLVGAKSSFIQKPFMVQGVGQGVFGSVIAITLIVGLIYLINKEFPDFFKYEDAMLFAKLFTAVFLLGVLISFVSTYFAVKKYIGMSLDELY